MAGTSDIYLVTRVSDTSKWAFTLEEEIAPSIELSYSAVDHVIEKFGRDTYVVRINIEDTINVEVYTVQRVTLLESASHM